MAIITNLQAEREMSQIERLARMPCVITKDADGFHECKCKSCQARNAIESACWGFSANFVDDIKLSGSTKEAEVSEAVARSKHITLHGGNRGHSKQFKR